ncbi:uncharacterized protein LOC135217036 [Macrobrachium nipponense]|uniref:uncharacterized protein LOC135217036 n=1 Tax=Macrobrachium nipponense TaxID=159736 RepID=UPI0030C88533
MDTVSRAALLIVLLLAYTRPGVALSILKTVIPFYKIRGEDAQLNCDYDLEGEPLYSVKWYKDDEEFYRYMPASNPPMNIFHRPGVTVETSRSNASRVVLTNLDFRSSGLYRCEISADDSFNTLNRFRRMMVVELPTRAPQISGVREKYVSGDTLHANCTAGSSHPAATITWHINGDEVPHKYTYAYPPILDKDGLETSVLGLRLKLRDRHFSGGVILLKCTATVAALYTHSDQDFLQVDDGKLQPIVLEQRNSLISVNVSNRLDKNVALLLTIVTILVGFRRH